MFDAEQIRIEGAVNLLCSDPTQMNASAQEAAEKYLLEVAWPLPKVTAALDRLSFGSHGG